MDSKYSKVIIRCGKNISSWCWGCVDCYTRDGVKDSNRKACDGCCIIEGSDGTNGNGDSANRYAGIILDSSSNGCVYIGPFVVGRAGMTAMA